MKTVLVLVDALRSNYLTEENMPFLYKLSRDYTYVREVQASPGFCERSEILSGLTPIQSNYFTALGYDPENSLYRKYKSLLKFLSISEKVWSRGAKYFGTAFLKKLSIPFNPYLIPFNQLSDFSLTEDGDVKYGRVVRTITDVLKEESHSFDYGLFTSLDRNKCIKINDVESYLTNKMIEGIEFLPLYIGEVDSWGHSYCNNLEEMRKVLLQVDNRIKKIYNLANNYEYRMIVLGDHGMVPIEKKIDVLSIIKKEMKKQNIQYKIFVDSTFVRFWCEEISNIKKIEIILHNLDEFGQIINTQIAKERNIPLHIKNDDNKNIYGDILWAAHPGVLISPDYFNPFKKKINGMHGYVEETNNSYGLMIISASHSKIVERCRLIDVCATLCHSLDIENPNIDSEAISLL